MLSLILLFSIAYAQVNVECTLDQKAYNYILQGNGKIAVSDMRKCKYIEEGQMDALYVVCTEDVVAFGQCPTQSVGDISIHWKEPLSRFGDRFSVGLPTHVVKAVPEDGDDDARDYFIYSSSCISEDGLYYKVSHDGETVTFTYYTDETCETPDSSSPSQVDCDGTLEGYKLICVNEELECTEDYMSESEYVLIGEGERIALKLNECIDFSNFDSISELKELGKVKITPCGEFSVALETCVEAGSEPTKKNVEFYDLGIKFVKDLPSHVVKVVKQPDENCNTESSHIMILLTDKCLKDDEAENQYYKVSVDNQKITRKYYSDASCATVMKEGNNDKQETMDCGSCEEGMKMVCSGSSNTPPSGEQPVTCDPSLATKYKYLVKTDGNEKTIKDLSQCVPIGERKMSMKVTPCTETQVSLAMCQNPTTEIAKSPIKDLGVYTETLPAHSVYVVEHTDNTCGTATVQDYKLFSVNECVKDYKKEGQYMKGQLDGDKMIFRYYSDASCNTAVEGAGATGEVTCGSCDDKNMKLVCHEYGKQPEQPKDESSGSIVTFILFAIALIFFLF